MSNTKEEIKTFKEYLREVLTGFMSLNSIGRDRAIGNLRWGDKTLSQRNRGILDDVQDIENFKIQNQNMKPQASCVYVTRNDGKILAVSRKDDSNDFGLPGGHVEPGEDPTVAAKRELREETGFHITDMNLIYESEDDNGYYVRIYAGKIHGKPHTKESGLIRWVSPEVLLRGSFGKFNKKFLSSIFRF